MCDTLVALSNATKDGSVIFGKNSDRPSDETQLISHVSHKTYSEGENLQCTCITIPQVEETAEIVLSQPFWMWGAEMGANEHGVVIGNEAVHTHEPLRKTGLLGMDLLRLGLERGKSTLDSLNVITALLETCHQGGGCAFGDSSWMYHNSFIITDSQEAYVLETADDWWIVEQVKDVRSISNGISIRGNGDLRREGIIQHAIDKGYCKDDDEFDFAVTFSGSAPSSSPFSRSGRSATLLKENIGSITPAMMMSFLRDHDAGICMHGGFESTGSQVSHLRKSKHSIHWFTGTTLPCASSYKPYTFPAEGLIFDEPGPFSQINPEWPWVKHARNKSRKIIPKLNSIEKDAVSKVSALILEEDKITNGDFINSIKKLNEETWKISQDFF